MVKRGEVWLIRLDPTVGSEIRKTRPCVVVSPDNLNPHLRTFLAAPMTSGSRPARYRISVDFGGRPGFILTEQLRTFDRDRLVHRVGVLDPKTLAAVLSTFRALFAD